jgi:nucleotide-binding universal stress UspA family protein
MSSFAVAPHVPALKNILFPTDFSPCSQAAFPYLRVFAERHGSTIHVLHVLAPEPMLEIPLDRNPELDADRDVARAAIKVLLSGNTFDKVAHTATVERGPLWKVLLECIEEKSIDLIALGTHGRHGLKKLVLGSVADQVFRLAPCPVLTVGPQAIHEEVANAGFATILFATDFSFGSLRALPYAVSLARTNNSHLILLHAVPASLEIVPSSFGNVGPATVEVSTEFVSDAIADARYQLEEMIPAENMQRLDPEVIVECGPAAETILKVTENKKANLIVMGAHRASVSSMVSSIASHLPWATASNVVCKARCPVLSVRN